MTTKFDTAIAALSTKIGAQAKALKKDPEVEIAAASTRLIESGMFDDDTLATVTRESLIAAQFSPGLADWFVSTFGTKPASSTAPALPTEFVLKHEKEEDPNELPIALLLGKIDFTKRDRYYAAARAKAGGQKCFVFDGAKLLIEPTVSLFERVTKGRKIPPTITIGSEVYYPRTIDQGPITTEEEWSVNPFQPSEPLSDDDTCDATGLSMKDVQPVTRSILILAQTRTFEQAAFTVHEIETRLESFKRDGGVRNAKRYYPKAGALVAQGIVVPLKRPAKSFRESQSAPTRTCTAEADDEVHPVKPSIGSSQRSVPADWYNNITAALISMGLSASRSALLCGIDPLISAGLANGSTDSDQLLQDVAGLNFVDRHNACPLRIYLANAVHLKPSRAGVDVLQRAIGYIDNAPAPSEKPLVFVLSTMNDRKLEAEAVTALSAIQNVIVQSSRSVPAGIDVETWMHSTIAKAARVVVIATADLVADDGAMVYAQQAIRAGTCLPIYARPFLYDISAFKGLSSIPHSQSAALSACNHDEIWTSVVRVIAREVGAL